jgi:hypothetical protein
LTPDRDQVRQINPDIDGSVAVWQEKRPGEDWEIVQYNLSSDGPAVTLTNNDLDDVEPTASGDWVTWEVRNSTTSDTTNVRVLDLDSGRVYHVPDSGSHETEPVAAPNGTIYYKQGGSNDAQMRAFDPGTGNVRSPIGNTRIQGDIGYDDGQLVWAEGGGSVKIHVRNLTTGRTQEVPGLHNLRDGPVLDDGGVGFVSRKSGAQSGTYTSRWHPEYGVEDLRTSVRPHDNVDACPTGFVWDQPGSGPSDRSAIGHWDRYLDELQTFGNDHFDPTCGFERILYEQPVNVNDPNEGASRYIYMIDLEENRLPSDPIVKTEDGFENSILRSPTVVSGVVEPVDPRVEITRIDAAVIGDDGQRVDTNATDDGMRWRMQIDPREYRSGEQTLVLLAQDSLNRTSRHEVSFYTETPFELNEGVFEQGVDVPREEGPGFPRNLLAHYETYQQFYNTLILVILGLALLTWYGVRWWRREDPGEPEYVPPDRP